MIRKSWKIVRKKGIEGGGIKFLSRVSTFGLVMLLHWDFM